MNRVRLKLQNKLTLFAAFVITLATASVGWLGITTAEQRELNQLSAMLDRSATQIEKSTGQELDTALLISETSGSNITVGFLDLNGDFSAIADGGVVLPDKWAAAELLSGISKSIATPNVPHALIRTVALPDNEWLIVAASTADLDSAKQANLTTLAGIILIADALAVLLVWLLIRPDVKRIRELIDDATSIAEGLDGELKVIGGSSEVLQLSDALERMVERLVSSRQAMQTFLGDASHELRTPLTVIRGYLEILQSQQEVATDSTSAKAVTRMLAEASRMQELINDLLLLAELGENQRQVERWSEIDLKQQVQLELEKLAELQPERKVELLADDEIHFAGDERLISRMLSNIFGNIRRHTPKAAAVSVAIEANEHGTFLTVEDAGPGLPPEQYEKVRLAFERFTAARDRESGGSGLGLSIIDGVVKAHGGSMTLAKSEKLGGLKTTIWLPTERS